MTLPEKTLETGVENSRAVMAAPPSLWSYSSLIEVGSCPRRFALMNAYYPELWDRQRYPTLPNLAALVGNVIHGALEMVVKALVDAGVTSVRDVQSSDVLRQLGGLSSVVERVITAQLGPLEENPRLNADRRRRFTRDLRARAPEARVQVQTYLSRIAFIPSAAKWSTARPHGSASTPQRRMLQEGSYAEVRLVADDLRLTGRIDLLTITGQSVGVVDYKSGALSTGHAEQLRLYALLWDRDGVANPDRRVVDRLVAAYREGDAVTATPSAAELTEMAAEYAARIDTADSELQSGDPTATPSAEVCRFCAVRQLCGPYWLQIVSAVATVEEGAWFDYQGVIGSRNGPRSWWVMSAESGRPELLLRAPDQTAQFEEGDGVRMLGLLRESDSELSTPIATIVATTEVFRMAI